MKYLSPGFSPELQEEHQTEEDYIFGAETKLGSEILVPSRDWRPYRPDFEVQKNDVFDPFTIERDDDITFEQLRSGCWRFPFYLSNKQPLFSWQREIT